MLRITLIAAMLAGGAAMADPAVVEAYHALKASGVAGELTYELRPAKGGWMTTSPDWGTDMPVVVDGANGFIEVLDEGTGGGSFRQQVVLWRMSDGTPLLGLGETAYDPPYPMTTRVRFFAPYGDGWEEWRQGLWPDPGLEDFLPNQATIADLRTLEEVDARILVDLPRHGVDITATLVTPDTHINAVCGGEDWFVPADPDAYLAYCNRVAGQVRRELSIAWDKENYQFTIRP